jgi:hypothetical protein
VVIVGVATGPADTNVDAILDNLEVRGIAAVFPSAIARSS